LNKGDSDKADFQTRGQTLNDKLKVRQNWVSEQNRIREQLAQGDPGEASKTLERAKSLFTGAPWEYVKADAEALKTEIGQAADGALLKQLAAACRQAEKETNDAKALDIALAALSNTGNNRYWERKLRREAAHRFYRLERYKECDDQLAALSGESDGTPG